MGKRVASLIEDARIADIPLGGHQVWLAKEQTICTVMFSPMIGPDTSVD